MNNGIKDRFHHGEFKELVLCSLLIIAITHVVFKTENIWQWKQGSLEGNSLGTNNDKVLHVQVNFLTLQFSLLFLACLITCFGFIYLLILRKQRKRTFSRKIAKGKQIFTIQKKEYLRGCGGEYKDCFGADKSSLIIFSTIEKYLKIKFQGNVKEPRNIQF